MPEGSLQHAFKGYVHVYWYFILVNVTHYLNNSFDRVYKDQGTTGFGMSSTMQGIITYLTKNLKPSKP